MTHTPNKQAASLLAHLESQQAQLATTIAYLRTMVGSATGHTDNGHAPVEKSPEAIVAKARAKFDARPPQQRKGRTPEKWRDDILFALRQEPRSAREILAWLGAGPGSYTSLFKHLKIALKARVIAKQGGGRYALAGSRRAATTARKTTTKRHNKKGGPKLRAQRQASLDLLNTFDTKEPRAFKGHSGKIGKLIAHGYLSRSTAGGYLRTNKAFQVAP
jgi:hypothetical protein